MESVFIIKTNKKLYNNNHFLYRHFLFYAPPVLQAGRFCMPFLPTAFCPLILNNTARMLQCAAYGRCFLFYWYGVSYIARPMQSRAPAQSGSQLLISKYPPLHTKHAYPPPCPAAGHSQRRSVTTALATRSINRASCSISTIVGRAATSSSSSCSRAATSK